MVYRVYVEKKAGQTHEADSLLKEIKDFLQIAPLELYRRREQLQHLVQHMRAPYTQLATAVFQKHLPVAPGAERMGFTDADGMDFAEDAGSDDFHHPVKRRFKTVVLPEIDFSGIPLYKLFQFCQILLRDRNGFFQKNGFAGLQGLCRVTDMIQ